MKIPWRFSNGVPDRPWWRAGSAVLSPMEGQGFRVRGYRGKRQTAAHWSPFNEVPLEALFEMDRIDREDPLPVPDPDVGQVWFYAVDLGGLHIKFVKDTVVSVQYDREGRWTIASMYRDELTPSRWPISGAALIDGPGAPWEGPRSPFVEKDPRSR